MSASTEAGFEELVAEHRQAVVRVCRSILRDDHLGADAAQETFLRLWRYQREGRPPGSTAAWLRKVAVSTSLDLARRRKTRAAKEDDLLTVDAGREHSAPAPEVELAERELLEHLERALATLSEGQRTIFLLRHAGGLPLAQVAETLGVAPTTVKTQFARACLRLQSALRAHRPRTDDRT